MHAHSSPDQNGGGIRRCVVFTDLDDSIFQTRRKCGDGQLYPAAFDKEGRPASYCTAPQRLLLELLQSQGTLVPVTARSLDAFQRVRLPFSHGAILNHGGLILRPDGSLDPSWLEYVEQCCFQAAPLLHELLAEAETLISRLKLDCRVRLIQDYGLTFYVIIKHNDRHPVDLETLKQALEPGLREKNVYTHFNDNNLAILPNFLGKAPAVRYFIEQYVLPVQPDPLLIGIGDSLSDLGFLECCTFMMTPARGQLATALHDRTKEMLS